MLYGGIVPSAKSAYFKDAGIQCAGIGGAVKVRVGVGKTALKAAYLLRRLRKLLHAAMLLTFCLAHFCPPHNIILKVNILCTEVGRLMLDAAIFEFAVNSSACNFPSLEIY